MKAPSRLPSDAEGDGSSVALAVCGASMGIEIECGGEASCIGRGLNEPLGALFSVETYCRSSSTLSEVSGEKCRTIVAINSNRSLEVW